MYNVEGRYKCIFIHKYGGLNIKTWTISFKFTLNTIYKAHERIVFHKRMSIYSKLVNKFIFHYHNQYIFNCRMCV